MPTVTLIVIALGSAWAASKLAERKGYDSTMWSVGALLVGPLAPLALLVMGTNPKTLRTCPDCKTRVPFDAPVCRHCGRDERTGTAPAA